MLDDIDKRLVHELLKDGRKHYMDLSKDIKISEGTARRRVSILQNKDIFRIVAELNTHNLGFGLISMMALRMRTAQMRETAEQLAKNPHVCFLSLMTGEYDVFAIIITRSTEELGKFIENEISSIPGIIRAETWICLDVIKGKWPAIETSQLINLL